jgi:hypothetical protein
MPYGSGRHGAHGTYVLLQKITLPEFRRVLWLRLTDGFAQNNGGVLLACAKQAMLFSREAGFVILREAVKIHFFTLA